MLEMGFTKFTSRISLILVFVLTSTFSALSFEVDHTPCCCCEFDLSLNCECIHENDTEDQVPSYALSVNLKKVLDLDKSFKLLRVVSLYNNPPLLLSDYNKGFYICSKNYATGSVVFLI
jgi:hypothetical protein